MGINVGFANLLSADMEISSDIENGEMMVCDIVEQRSSSSSSSEEGEDGEEERKMLKRRISCHPLYGFLLEAHLDCLKVSLGSNENPGGNHKSDEKNRHNQPRSSMLCQSELDYFMEAYCTTLIKLKEAMEEPQEQTLAFINSMQSQLKELTDIQHDPPQSPTIFPGQRTE